MARIRILYENTLTPVDNEIVEIPDDMLVFFRKTYSNKYVLQEIPDEFVDNQTISDIINNAVKKCLNEEAKEMRAAKAREEKMALEAKNRESKKILTKKQRSLALLLKNGRITQEQFNAAEEKLKKEL